jgi:hypothetical protein
VAFTLLRFWSDRPELNGLAHLMGPWAIILGWALLIIIEAVALQVLILIRSAILAPEWRNRAIIASRHVRTTWMSVMLLLVRVVQGVVDVGAPSI